MYRCYHLILFGPNVSISLSEKTAMTWRNHRKLRFCRSRCWRRWRSTRANGDPACPWCSPKPSWRSRTCVASALKVRKQKSSLCVIIGTGICFYTWGEKISVNENHPCLYFCRSWEGGDTEDGDSRFHASSDWGDAGGSAEPGEPAEGPLSVRKDQAHTSTTSFRICPSLVPSH